MAIGLSVGLYLWLAGEPPAATPVSRVGEAPEVGTANAGERTAQPWKEEGRGDATGDGGLERRVLPDERISTDDPGGLIVQVWDREPGMPAVGAAILFLDGFDGPELGDPFAQHWSDLAETRGQRFMADAAGRAVLPPVKRWAIVTARRPGAYAFIKVGVEHEETTTLVLHADETVTVQVLDMRDQPAAGVPVGVLQMEPVRFDQKRWRRQLKLLDRAMARVKTSMRDGSGRDVVAAKKRIEGLLQRRASVTSRLEGQDTGRKRAATEQDDRRGGKIRGAQAGPVDDPPAWSTEPRLLARRLTDDDGVAVFRHFQVYRRKPEPWWPPEQRDRFAATRLLPLARPEMEFFAGRPVSADPIVLRLPPTGSIALRTVDLQGEPFRHPVSGKLRMRDMQIAAWQQFVIRKDQGEETVLFPRVGLGMQFTAHCRLDDDDFQWDVPLFAGPTNPGQRVSVDVVVAPGAGMLRGRLLDRSGRTLAGERLSLLINLLAGRLEGEELILDDESRFHLPYKRREGQAPPFELSIRRADVTPASGLLMTLPDLARQGVTDLGDLKIDELPLVARGRVHDDLGQPIEGATIRLERGFGDDLPEKIEAWDRRSGRVARWYQKGRFAGAPLGKDDVARLRLSCDGQYRAVAYLGERTRDKPAAALDLGTIELRLRPGSETQRFTLTVDAEQVAAALNETGGAS